MLNNLYYQDRTTVTLFVSVLLLPGSLAASYNESKQVLDTLLDKARYSPHMRPLLDQDNIMYVNVYIQLVSIVEISDIEQSFIWNGFLSLYWTDELLRWNPQDFNGTLMVTPEVKDIFRPNVVLMNALKERDLLKRDEGVASVFHNGTTVWVAGSLFPASCQLDLTYYPFDRQTCLIELAPINFGPSQLRFSTIFDHVMLQFYIENSEWDLLSARVETPLAILEGGNLSTIKATFEIKRKPRFLVISILLPIVFLSLLNIFVFLIPVESGEKISYGITVLLALSVFMSIMSAMLPRSAETMPLLIMYIFGLLTLSVMTVVDSIVIVKLHHMDEKEDEHLKVKNGCEEVHPMASVVRHAKENELPPSSIVNCKVTVTTPIRQMPERHMPQNCFNKFKFIEKYMNMASFVAFGVIWLGLTFGFLGAVALS